MAIGSPIRSLFQNSDEPVHAVSLGDAIDQRLITAIVRGELPPGKKLSEVELATRFGVSRTPLRDALTRLASEGLVLREANRGVRVAPIDAQQTIEFYDCRILLETKTIELAAPYFGDVQLSKLNRILDRLRSLESSLPEDDARWTWLGVVEEFHDTYRSACPNRELVSIVHSLANRALRLRMLNIGRSGRMAYSLAQHVRIAEALSKRDPDASVIALAELLETSKVGILASIAQLPKLDIS